MNKNSFYAFMAAALVTASCTTNEVPNDAISQSVTIVATYLLNLVLRS